MQEAQKKRVEEILDKLVQLRAEITAVQMKEQEIFDDLTEDDSSDENENSIECLQEALDAIEDVESALDHAQGGE